MADLEVVMMGRTYGYLVVVIELVRSYLHIQIHDNVLACGMLCGPA
jgi:hypothetical protein